MIGTEAHLTVAIETETVDLVSAEAFTAELDGAVAQARDAGADRLTIDLSAVTFIDSMGVGSMIDAHREAGEHGIRLDATGAQRSVHLAFDVLGLVDTFGLY